jgi:hypothetical protein
MLERWQRFVIASGPLYDNVQWLLCGLVVYAVFALVS